MKAEWLVASLAILLAFFAYMASIGQAKEALNVIGVLVFFYWWLK